MIGGRRLMTAKRQALRSAGTSAMCVGLRHRPSTVLSSVASPSKRAAALFPANSPFQQGFEDGWRCRLRPGLQGRQCPERKLHRQVEDLLEVSRLLQTGLLKLCDDAHTLMQV